MGSKAPRSVRWALAAFLFAAIAAAGIAANVVLLGLSRQGEEDPVGRFKPHLGLASVTYAAKPSSVPRRPLKKPTHGSRATTLPSSSSETWTTVTEREPGESDDD